MELVPRAAELLSEALVELPLVAVLDDVVAASLEVLLAHGADDLPRGLLRSGVGDKLLGNRHRVAHLIEALAAAVLDLHANGLERLDDVAQEVVVLVVVVLLQAGRVLELETEVGVLVRLVGQSRGRRQCSRKAEAADQLPALQALRQLTGRLPEGAEGRRARPSHNADHQREAHHCARARIPVRLHHCLCVAKMDNRTGSGGKCRQCTVLSQNGYGKKIYIYI